MVGHLLVPGAAGVEILQPRTDNGVNDPVEQVVFVPDVAVEPHGAEPARLGDTPDGQRVDPFPVDDVDGGGDHVVSRDPASSAAWGPLASRHAYIVAYLVHEQEGSAADPHHGRKIATTDTTTPP